MIDVSLIETEPMTVAFVAKRGAYTQMPQALGQLYGFVRTSSFTPAGMPHGVYFTAPGTGPESDAMWEAWAPIAGDVPEAGPDGGGLGVKHVPAQLVASTMHKGPYESMPSAYRELGEWIAAAGYGINGPPMELYLSDPNNVPPEEYITEIQFPVAKR
jgi:AraC family transcriptional regulator